VPPHRRHKPAVAVGGLVSRPVELDSETALSFLEGSALVTDTRTAARAMFAEELRPELERIRCPTLVLWGARDWIVSPQDAFEYARHLRAPVRLLPDTGHLLIGERPAECARLIEEFLGS
jgi:pimeloyl-ACP methyl ester carboxylesterase